MALSILVCIKSVALKAPEKGGASPRDPDNCVLNPFDRPALETALALARENGGRVTALSMGPEASKGALYEALAMGADQAVLLCDPALAGADTFATATALAAAIKTMEPQDLVVFGARTSDSDTGQVGSQTAVLLDLPLVCLAEQVKQEGETLLVTSRVDGFVETWSLAPPAALTVSPQGAIPRDVGLAGLARAFGEMDILFRTLEDIGLEPENAGLAGSPTQVLSMARAGKKRQCAFLKGSPGDQARDLVRQLVDRGLLD